MRIYTAPEHAAKLNRFLTDHLDHPLRLVDDEKRPDDWTSLDFPGD